MTASPSSKATHPAESREPAPDALPARTGSSWGPTLLGVGMIAFAGAVVFHTVVRLRGTEDGGAASRSNVPDEDADGSEAGSRSAKSKARRTTGKADPKAPAEPDPVGETAFGPLAEELGTRHPPEFYFALGRMMLEGHEPRLAARMFRAAEMGWRAEPASDPALRRTAVRRLAESLRRSGDPDGALAVFREELRKTGTDKASVPLWRDLADLHVARRDHDGAAAALDRVLKLADAEGDLAAARQALWQVWGTTGKAAGKLAEFRRRITDRPDDEEALRLCLEYWCHVRPDPGEASRVLELLLRRRPTDMVLREMQLQALAALGRDEETVAMAESLAAAEPARAGQFYAEAADLLHEAGRTDAAGRLVTGRLETSTDGPSVARAAMFHRRRGADPRKAAELFRRAQTLTTTRESREGWRLDEADCLAEMGRRDLCRALVEPLATDGGSAAIRLRATVLLRKLDASGPAGAGGGSGPIPASLPGRE